MAGRKAGFKHSEKTRGKIKTTQIINRLQAFVNGEEDKKTGGPVRMSPPQVKAAEILLNKTLPSLSMSDVLTKTDDQKTPEELRVQLVAILGEDKVRELFPEFITH